VLHLGKVIHTIGFDSPTIYSEFLCVAFVLESWATVVIFLLSNILGNLICISFVHIYHILKIENQHIHNQQKSLLKNKCVIDYYSKIEFFFGIHIRFQILRKSLLVSIG
jgi:hypothetical protein